MVIVHCYVNLPDGIYQDHALAIANLFKILRGFLGRSPNAGSPG